MITIYVLMVFINGTAVPTTEFNSKAECDYFKIIVSENTIDIRPKPICIPLLKSK